MDDTVERIKINWSGDKPPDWAEWERIIRQSLDWVPRGGGGEVDVEYDGYSWRVKAVSMREGPKDAASETQRRHRVTETLRAHGKPAGLRGAGGPGE